MNDFGRHTFRSLSKRTCLVVVSVLMGWGFAFTIGGASAQDRDGAKISLLMVTGMPGGTCYQVGLGMASLWTTKLREAGIRVSAAHSEGTRENIEAIRISDADLILAEEFFCSMAFSRFGDLQRPIASGVAQHYDSLAGRDTFINKCGQVRIRDNSGSPRTYSGHGSA